MTGNQKWWDSIKEKYPFQANAPISIKPHLVSDCGHHASAKLHTGWRRWGFETADDRDKFVLQYGGIPLVNIREQS